MTLPRALLLDAAACAILAVLCLTATQPVVAATGLPSIVVSLAGIICAPTALLCGSLATRPIRPLLGLLVIGNFAWVAASVAVWIANFGQLTAAGHAIVIAQALAVEFVTLLEWRGFKALGATPVTA